jgi:hypothetical protein
MGRARRRALLLSSAFCMSMLLAAPAPALASAAPSASFFVGPALSLGNDASDYGLSPSRPLASLHEAQRRARLAASASSDAEVTVWLLPGTHSLASPLLLGAQDARTHYRGLGSAGSVVLSGGVNITSWSPSAPSNATSFLTAPWPAVLAGSNPRQFFVGGNRASPSADAPSVWGLTSNTTNTTATGFLTSSSLPLTWPQQPYRVEFVWGTEFQQSRCYVAGVASLPNGTTSITMDSPCFPFGLELGQVGGLPQVVLNAAAPSALQPGCWQLSPDASTVAYAPLDAAERTALLDGSLVPLVPALDLLLSVDGSPGPTAFSNITFAYAGWPGPEPGNGFLERYGGVRYQPCETADAGATCYNATTAPAAGCRVPCALAMTPSAVRVMASSNITFTGCTFAHLGGHALGFFNGTSDSGVSQSLFADLAGGAVHIANVNETQFEDPEMQTRNVFVEDSVFLLVGSQFQGAVAVSLFAGVGSIVQHNAVGPIPYTAFSFGWSVPQTSSYSRDNLLLANTVNSPCMWGQDGGPVHTIGPNAATMAFNYFYNQTRGRAAWYVDNTSQGYNMTRNVVDNTPGSSPFWLFFQQSCDSHNNCGNAGRDNFAWDIWVRCAPDSPFPYDNRNSSVWNVTHLNASQAFPADAQEVIAAAGPRPGTAFYGVVAK